VTKLTATGPERWDYATAPLFLAVGVTLSLVVFPPPSGYVGITVVTLGDGVAKIVGRRWGRTVIPFNKPKTIEGTLAGLIVSAFAASLFTPPPIALLAATLGMLIEALPSPVNDNLSVPLLTGLATIITT
jgi:dolichol kinase